MTSRVLIVTGDAGESYETLYAKHRFEEAGWEALIAAPSKRRLHLVMHDFAEGWDTYIERGGYELPADTTFAEANVDDYQAVLLIGGRAPEYLRHDEQLLSLVRAFAERGKWLLSICHGIQILVAAGLVRDRQVTCYEHVRYEVEACGGHFVGAEAVCDGHLISAQTWQSHPDFYRLIFAKCGNPA